MYLAICSFWHFTHTIFWMPLVCQIKDDAETDRGVPVTKYHVYLRTKTPCNISTFFSMGDDSPFFKAFCMTMIMF